MLQKCEAIDEGQNASPALGGPIAVPVTELGLARPTLTRSETKGTAKPVLISTQGDVMMEGSTPPVVDAARRPPVLSHSRSVEPRGGVSAVSRHGSLAGGSARFDSH
jgi:hypothetical protein